jgi:hypothetical protein
MWTVFFVTVRPNWGSGEYSNEILSLIKGQKI